MTLLKITIENQRWELAAHIIVLTTTELLDKGDRLYAGKYREKKKRRPQGQSKR